MMRPIDIHPADQQEHPTPGGRAPWWALLVLVVVMTAVVAGVIALSGDNTGESLRQTPTTEGPEAPGT